MYRFKLIRRVPIYRLTKTLLARAEDELRSLAMKLTPESDADLKVQHIITDSEGEETVDTIDGHPGSLSESTHTVEILITSESANFVILLNLHRDNPHDNWMHVTSSGENARGHCWTVYDVLLRALCEFVRQPGDTAHPPGEAKSFVLAVPSVSISESAFVDLERHLIRAAAEHTRLSPSSIAKELRVTLKAGENTETFSSIALRGEDSALPEAFSELTVELWSWGDIGDERKYKADVELVPHDPNGCRIKIACEGEGSIVAADMSRTWLEKWLRKCQNDNQRWRLTKGRQLFLVLTAVYAGVGGLFAFIGNEVPLGIVLVGFAVAAIVTFKYAPRVWPHVRLTHTKEEQSYNSLVGRFKAFVGAFLFIGVILPVLLHLALTLR